MDVLRFDHVTDEGRVILSDGSGKQYEVEVSPTLRGAVRGSTSLTAQMLEERGGKLQPKDVQALIRSGATVEDVAEASGIPMDTINRYAGPILDERAYVAQQARAFAVAHDPGAPALEVQAAERLATRGVNLDDIVWDAVREAHRWILSVVFTIGSRPSEARWAVDLPGRSLTPLDDEARWMSEAEKDGPLGPWRSATRTSDAAAIDIVPVGDQTPAPAGSHTRDDEDNGEQATITLLDDLYAQRGVRQPVHDDDSTQALPTAAFAAVPPLPDDDDAEVLDLPLQGLHSAPVPVDHLEFDDTAFDADGELIPRPEDDVVTDDTSAQLILDTGQSDDPSVDEKPQTRRGRSGRASIPSWDEIVFGAKSTPDPTQDQ